MGVFEEFDEEEKKDESTSVKEGEFGYSDYFAADDYKIPVFFQPGARPQQANEISPPVKPKGLALAIVGFVLGILAFMNGLSLLATVLLSDMNIVYSLDDSAEAFELGLSIDTVYAIVLSVFVILMAIAAVVLSSIALAKNKKNEKKKRIKVFSVIGLCGAGVAVIMAIIALVLALI